MYQRIIAHGREVSDCETISDIVELHNFLAEEEKGADRPHFHLVLRLFGC